jgi:AraC family transcriptional regulator
LTAHIVALAKAWRGTVALSSIKAQLHPGAVVRTALTERFSLSERFYGSHFSSPVHAHVKDYLIITLDGRYHSTFGTRTEEFKPWTVTYHQAGALHTSRYGSRGARVLYVELPVERMREFWSTTASHLTHFSLNGGVLEWTARQLYGEFTSADAFSPVMMDGLVMQLLAHLVRRRNASPQRLPTWLGNADETIRSRFAEPLALSDIAQMVSVHPVHLAREYRRYYNCTIGKQIRRLRIEYACEQLSSTDLALADIALSAGFFDQSHFAASFKQQLGTSPSRYRKAVKTKLLSQQNVS